MSAVRRVRALIVDDSAIARDLLERGLSLDPGIEVVGKASDAYSARDKIVFLKPDVVTLDVEMPKMDGIAFLRKLMPQYPLPVIVVSAVTAEGSRKALEALEAGAFDIVAKPSAYDAFGLKAMVAELAEKVKAAGRTEPGKIRSLAGGLARPSPSAGRPAHDRRFRGRPVGKVIALGASTGGTVALSKVVTALPADSPPVLIVQHMPPVFTRMFAESMDRQSAVRVKEAEDGEELERGTALVAPGDLHLTVVRSGRRLEARLDDGPKVSGHRPSVDALFLSAAEAVGPDAVAALLTGMGRDGADGMLALRRSGARCVAQDEPSSVVFGMPREAWENGSAETLVPIELMAREIMARVGARAAGRA